MQSVSVGRSMWSGRGGACGTRPRAADTVPRPDQGGAGRDNMGSQASTTPLCAAPLRHAPPRSARGVPSRSLPLSCCCAGLGRAGLGCESGWGLGMGSSLGVGPGRAAGPSAGRGREGQGRSGDPFPAGGAHHHPQRQRNKREKISDALPPGLGPQSGSRSALPCPTLPGKGPPWLARHRGAGGAVGPGPSGWF